MRHVLVVSIPAERKIFFWPSVFFLLVCHYEHLYLVKEAQSRNKRSLWSSASCTSSMDTCSEKNSFLIGGGGGSRSCCQYVLCVMRKTVFEVQKKCKQGPDCLGPQFHFISCFTRKMLGAQEDTLKRIYSTGVGDDRRCGWEMNRILTPTLTNYISPSSMSIWRSLKCFPPGSTWRKIQKMLNKTVH